MEKYVYFLILFLWVRVIALEYPSSQWIIWNVGQGQWITFVYQHYCWHFDFGGEKNPIQEVFKLCHWRENHLLLSHPDRDHYNFLPSLKEKLKNICLQGPSWKTFSLRKLNATTIPFCSTTSEDFFAHSIYTPSPHRKKSRRRSSKVNPSKASLSKVASIDPNKLSQFFHSDRWLITGDAPQALEKEWLTHTDDEVEQRITRLILGHHGSKTSTSPELLNHLSHLRQCISSSREKKYGHPHPDVRQRLLSHCSLIRTEDWNHIHYLEGL